MERSLEQPESVLEALNEFIRDFCDEAGLGCGDIFSTIEEGIAQWEGLNEICCSPYSENHGRHSIFNGKLTLTPFGSLTIVNVRNDRHAKFETLLKSDFKCVDPRNETEIAKALFEDVLPKMLLRQKATKQFGNACIAVCDDVLFLTQAIEYLNRSFETNVFHMKIGPFPTRFLMQRELKKED